MDTSMVLQQYCRVLPKLSLGLYGLRVLGCGGMVVSLVSCFVLSAEVFGV